MKSIPLKVFGVGGAGVNVLEQVLKSDLAGAAFVAVDTNARSLAASSAPGKIQLVKSSMRGQGDSPGQPSVEDDIPKLKAACAGTDVVVILSGLGGRTGTELSTVLAAQAKDTGAMVLAFVTLPFDCEGSLRRQSADDGLKHLEAMADTVICLPNQKTCALVGEDTSLVDTFKIANQWLTDSVRGVWRAWTSASVMGLPFPELCALLGRGSSGCAFALAEAAGANRAREVVEKLLAQPMLAGGCVLQRAKSMLVSVVGGPDLAMAEVNRVMDQINRECHGAPIVMGAGISPFFQGSLALVLFVAPHGEMTDEMAAQREVSGPKSSRASKTGSSELDTQLLARDPTTRPHSRYVPPPPVLTPEQREQFIAKQTGANARQRRNAARLRQTQLQLEIVSKGRFDKSEPTIHKGEDLDVPTYIRRGVALN